MEHKMQAADGLKFVESAESPNGEFTAYASTWANWDLVGERPVKGAFTPHLEAFKTDGFIALGHSWDALPIAYPLEAYEDEHGLFVRAAFHSTPEAQKARTVLQERLAQGKSAKTSIGYTVLKDEQTDEGRLLKEIKLMEISIVNVPANPLANVLASKSGEVSTLGFNEHAEAVVSAVEAFAERAVSRHDFRTKDGRVLSTANFATLEQAYQSIGKVLESARRAPPEDSEKHMVEIERLRADWLRINAQQLPTFGVKTT
jgi:HK97 family phage prohead protease